MSVIMSVPDMIYMSVDILVPDIMSESVGAGLIMSMSVGACYHVYVG